MTRRLLLLLAATAVVTGCGGSSSSPSKPTRQSTLDAVKRDLARTVADCRQAASNPGLPADQKAILVSECSDIQSGNSTALRADGVRLCVIEANAMPLARRATVLAACKAKVG